MVYSLPGGGWKIPMKPKTRILIVCALFGTATGASACSTPVFRYALERWTPDPYVLVGFTDGPLTDAHKNALDQLSGYRLSGYAPPPFDLETVDITEGAGPWEDLREIISTNRPAPCTVLTAPQDSGRGVLWIDDFSEDALRRMVISPARAEIARRILAGDAAVWLLLRGTDETENRTVRAALDETLAEIHAGIEYSPDFVRTAEEEGRSPLPFRFSVLEVDRKDPQEVVLIHMLPDVPSYPEEKPLVIPVFGQGRALTILEPRFVVPQSILQIAAFLAGPCSCQVKSQNPGFDLLIPVDWIGGITEEYVYDDPEPALISFADLVPAAAVEQQGADDPSVLRAAGEKPLFVYSLAILLLTSIAGVGLATAWVTGRKS